MQGIRNNSTPHLQQHIKTHLEVKPQSQATTFRNKFIKSTMKSRERLERSNGIRLRESFYNDENLDYLSRSSVMLRNSKSYQAKPISQSTRRRIDTEKVEEVVRRKRWPGSQVRSEGGSDERGLGEWGKARGRGAADVKSIKGIRTRSLAAKQIMANQSAPKINKNILENYIHTQLKNNQPEVKWFSAFKNKSKSQNPFDGKAIRSVKKIQKPTGQVKILNLDRLFKGKSNPKSNAPTPPSPSVKYITPKPTTTTNTILPKAKIATTSNPSETKGATLNFLIRQYNNLCKIDSFLKVRKGISYVKGKTFAQQPTLEQMLGIRTKTLKSYSTSTPMIKAQQYLSPSVFQQYCVFHRQNIRKQPYLRQRFLSALKTTQPGLTLQSYLHFHELFVSRTASHKLRLQFLQYFFLPYPSDTISIEMFKLLMELLSERLPDVASAQVKFKDYDLTQQEKTKIFYETLMRVLVGEVEDRLREVGQVNRDVLRWIFGRNEEAMELLMLLFYQRGKGALADKLKK